MARVASRKARQQRKAAERRKAITQQQKKNAQVNAQRREQALQAQAFTLPTLTPTLMQEKAAPQRVSTFTPEESRVERVRAYSEKLSRLERVRINNTPNRRQRKIYWEQLSEEEMQKLGEMYSTGVWEPWEETLVEYDPAIHGDIHDLV